MTHKTRNRRNRSLNEILSEAFDAGFRALSAGTSTPASPIARDLADDSDEPQLPRPTKARHRTLTRRVRRTG